MAPYLACHISLEKGEILVVFNICTPALLCRYLVFH
jgi:hypothetical protein